MALREFFGLGSVARSIAREARTRSFPVPGFPGCTLVQVVPPLSRKQVPPTTSTRVAVTCPGKAVFPRYPRAEGQGNQPGRSPMSRPSARRSASGSPTPSPSLRRRGVHCSGTSVYDPQVETFARTVRTGPRHSGRDPDGGRLESVAHRHRRCAPTRARAELEAVQHHHLVPRRDEVLDESLLRVAAGVDLGEGAELRVRAEN